MNPRAKAYGFMVALIFHALVITWLTIAVVAVVTVQQEPPVPEPLKIDIGEQELTPPEASADPQDVPVPPVGEESEVEEEDKAPTRPNDTAMLKDPDEPPPEEITESARKGLPGVPTPESKPGELKQIVKGPESQGVPKVFGVPIEGNTVFLVDLSGSMDEKHGKGTRLQYVLGELEEAINSLKETDLFDVVAFSGSYMTAGYVRQWNGSLRAATEVGKEDAIWWLSTLIPDGSTPTYQALAYIFREYPSSVDNFVLVTDGIPDSGQEPLIVGNIRGWMSNFPEATLICIGIGEQGLPFVKRLVDAVNGAYVEVK